MQILTSFDNVPANSEKEFCLNCKVLSFQNLNLDDNVKIKINNYDSAISIYKNFVYHSEDENIFKLRVINDNAEQLNFELLYGENFTVKNQKVISVNQPVSSELIGEQAGDLNNISNQANSGIVMLIPINAKLNHIVIDSNEKIYNFFVLYKGSPVAPHLLIQEVDLNTGTVTEISETEIDVIDGKYNYEFNLCTLPAKTFTINTPYEIRINSCAKTTEVGSSDISHFYICNIFSGGEKSKTLKTVVFNDAEEIFFRTWNAKKISNIEIRDGSARALLLQLQAKNFS